MDAIVAIPVKNEAERIGGCLQALDRQLGGHPLRVLLLLNDCSDGTAEAVQTVRSSLSVPVEAVEVAMPPGQAGAGFARRLAMERAFGQAGQAVLMTTDADSRVAPDWVAANLAWIRRGADAVAGRAVIDPLEAQLIPQRLHEADARECAYADLLDHIAAELDPDVADPWPRHTEHSGASIAVTSGAYRRAGGVPAVALGEDRALFASLRRIDARVRHAPEVTVVVSGRIHGRATGGMADTIRRRMIMPDPVLDDRLEPARDAARRARLRQMLRGVFRGEGAVAVAAVRLGLPTAQLARLLAAPHFGAAMEAIEAASPRLRKLPVRVEQLPLEMARARRIFAGLLRRPERAEGPADSLPAAVGSPARG